MVRYECDSCRKLKTDDDNWILAFAAENIGVTSARREITTSPTWDEARAVDWLAVHFCSDKCRSDYMARLFGEQSPATVSKSVIERTVVPDKKILHVVPQKDRMIKKRVARKRKIS